MTMTINTTTDHLGHQLRLSLRAEIESTLVFENQLRQQIADHADPETCVALADRVALAELEAHEADLWDALANAQQIR